MAKGISLNDFKNAVSSEASIENERLKKELSDLQRACKDRVKELTEERDTNDRYVHSLGSRCFVLTKGVLCITCGIHTCPYYVSSSKLLDAVQLLRDKDRTFDGEMVDKVDQILKGMERGEE